jgi:hypothetical protein
VTIASEMKEILARSRAAHAAASALLPAGPDRVVKGLAMTMLHHREDAVSAVHRMRAMGWEKDYPAIFVALP